MFNNFWVIYAPVFFLLVLAVSWECKGVFWPATPGAIKLRRIITICGGSALCLFLFMESHRGMVQALRDWMRDPNGKYDFENSILASVIFIAVSAFYAWLLSRVMLLVSRMRLAWDAASTSDSPKEAQSCKKSAAKAPSSQPVQTQEESEPAQTLFHFDRPVLALDTFSYHDLGRACWASREMALGESKEFAISCVQRYVGKYVVSEDEAYRLRFTAPYEMQIDITDLPEDDQ